MVCRDGSKGSQEAAPIQKSVAMPPKRSVKWLHCAMFVLVTIIVVFVLNFLMLIVGVVWLF